MSIPNVHAGAKYMAELMDEYFKGIPFDEQNRTLFAFAAYNAGAGKIQSLRREAAAQNLDPNLWFNNVERMAAARVGQETVPSRISRTNHNIAVRICRICHEYQYVVVGMVASWNTQRVNQMMDLCGSILTGTASGISRLPHHLRRWTACVSRTRRRSRPDRSSRWRSFRRSSGQEHPAFTDRTVSSIRVWPPRRV
jgi:membrane-bound lytic murein transglycosylase MltF